MNRLTASRRTLRQALTIARRDFTATVFTPVFLVFLFAPVLFGLMGPVAGMGASSAMRGGGTNRLVAIVPAADAGAVRAADARLRGLYRDADDAPPPLQIVAPAGDLAIQARSAINDPVRETSAVLFAPGGRPHILFGPAGNRSADYLATLTTAAAAPRVDPVRIAVGADRPSKGPRHASAFFAVFGIFFLTLFLSGQVVGSMMEERNNKVIEVLAAAVPLESVFFGKLIGMFGVAIVFVAFWGSAVTGIGSLAPAGMAKVLAALSPAVGPVFPVLFFAYFAMAYMLLGAVFLGVGAQANSTREIQLLSLPITILQVAMFGLSSAAATRPGSGLALFAELFPLSSPFAMTGHAASRPELWPHFAALAWQALWVTIFVSVGARAFRRGVLQSGSARPRWWPGRRAPA